jgi:hypothetical protein
LLLPVINGLLKPGCSDPLLVLLQSAAAAAGDQGRKQLTTAAACALQLPAVAQHTFA